MKDRSNNAFELPSQRCSQVATFEYRFSDFYNAKQLFELAPQESYDLLRSLFLLTRQFIWPAGTA